MFSSISTSHSFSYAFIISFPLTLTSVHESIRLLGLSAFAGFAILLASWPLNNYVARRSVRIQKGVSTSRDKRMGVLNELIGAVSLAFVYV